MEFTLWGKPKTGTDDWHLWGEQEEKYYRACPGTPPVGPGALVILDAGTIPPTDQCCASCLELLETDVDGAGGDDDQADGEAGTDATPAEKKKAGPARKGMDVLVRRMAGGPVVLVAPGRIKKLRGKTAEIHVSPLAGRPAMTMIDVPRDPKGPEGDKIPGWWPRDE
jgi:hypothetical protein